MGICLPCLNGSSEDYGDLQPDPVTVNAIQSALVLLHIIYILATEMSEITDTVAGYRQGSQQTRHQWRH